MKQHHAPQLSRMQTADLAINLPTSMSEAPDYGVPLQAAVTDASDWLSAAILAGYVPSFHGIELALRGYQLVCLSAGTYLEATGASLVGPTWTARRDYPTLVDLLQGQIDELERRFGDPTEILGFDD